jgi:osmotically inducible lipoprotein OsmB
MSTPLRIAVIVIACSGLGACAHWSNAEKGTAIGAVGGAAVGNAVTGGSALGTAAGAIGGGIIGHELGEDRDRYQRRRR